VRRKGGGGWRRRESRFGDSGRRGMCSRFVVLGLLL
jgi:hypothetical protein